MQAGLIESMVPSPRAAAAMAQRAQLIAASEANGRAVLSPQDPGGLSQGARLAFAARIAALNGDEALAAHYRAAPVGEPYAQDASFLAMQRHVDLVTTTPRQATRDDISTLQQAGVADADIVRLSQLIAFVNYQVRLIAGLRLIGAP